MLRMQESNLRLREHESREIPLLQLAIINIITPDFVFLNNTPIFGNMEVKQYINEVWKPIRGWENLYEVSNMGRVRSVDRIITYSNGGVRLYKGKIRKLFEDNDGYPIVVLSHNNRLKTLKVHKIEMDAFVPNPDNLPCVNHKDENKHNNYIHVNDDGTIDLEKSNLEWCTHKYNTNYGTCIERGRMKHRNNKTVSKPILMLSKHRIPLKLFPSEAEASRITGISRAVINNYINGKTKKLPGGFIWVRKKGA